VSASAATNLTWHHGDVGRDERARLLGHRAATIWLTGLSGAGKSTLARRAERLLIDRGVLAYVLDGDNLRHGLNADLGFGPEARAENVRRAGEVARLLTDAGVLVITALISPYRADRQRVRSLFGPGEFVEVWCAASFEECEARDPKGLYRRARAGEIRDFTGLDAPYEPPEAAELVLQTGREDVNASAGRLLAWLETHGYVPRDGGDR
jgi:adenylylsulfate kinase